jgi:hypothetical protein
VQFTETGEWSPAWKGEAQPDPPLVQPAPPPLPIRPGYATGPYSPVRSVFSTPPRGGDRGYSLDHQRATTGHFTPPSTIPWSSYGNVSPPSHNSWSTPPRGTPGTGRGRGSRGKSRWSPERAPHVYWRTATSRVLPHPPTQEGVPRQPRAMHPGDTLLLPAPQLAGSSTLLPAPQLAPAAAQDAVTLLQRIRSFIALRDPDLLATATADVGAVALL